MKKHGIAGTGVADGVKHLLVPRTVTGRLLLYTILIGGCAIVPQELTVGEMEQQRAADLQQMFGSEAKVERPLSLADVIARALRYNLDHRVKVVEEAHALDLTRLDGFELLPKLAANGAYYGRSNPSGSSSRSLLSGRQSLEASTSQDEERVTSDLDLTWNILDFGVSYFNARQNADRRFIARERERKVIQNLVQEAQSAYWRVVATQKLKPRVDATIKLAESALVDAQKAEAGELRSPMDSLRYRKTLLESMRQLETILREMATAQVELAAMMTLPPGTDYKVSVPEGAMSAPVWTTSLEKMEELALLNQPDMREMAYQGRIVADENVKNLLKFFPSISFSASRKQDSNSFSLNKDWYETGLRVTWNLMSLLSSPEQWDYNRTNVEVVEVKRLALRMALLSQVHVAYRQFDLALTQLQRSKELFLVEKEIAQHVENRVDLDAQGVLDRIATDTSAILAELRWYHSLAQAHNALGRMMASTGQDPDVKPIQGGSLSDLTERVKQWLASQVVADPPSAVNRNGSLLTDVARDVESVAKTDQRSPGTARDHACVCKNPGERHEPSIVGQNGVVQSRTRVRHGPGSIYETIRVVFPGTTLTVLEVDPGGQWGRIGEGEWVALHLLDLSPSRTESAAGGRGFPVDADVHSAVTPTSVSMAGQMGIVRDRTRVRRGPGVDYESLRILQSGELLTVLEAGPNGQWYRTGEGEWVDSQVLDLLPPGSRSTGISNVGDSSSGGDSGVSTHSGRVPTPTVGQKGIVREGARVRSGPGLHNKTRHLLRPGEPLTVFEVDPSGQWYRIGLGEWLASSVVSLEPSLPEVVRHEEIPGSQARTDASAGMGRALPPHVGQTGTVWDFARVRNGPGPNHETLRLARPGEPLTVLEVDSGGQWCRVGSGEWVASSMFSARSSLPQRPASPVGSDHLSQASSSPSEPGVAVAVNGPAVGVGRVVESGHGGGLVVGQKGVVPGRAQVHIGPGPNQETVRILLPGDIVTVFEIDPTGQWYRIGEWEWVLSSQISPQD